MTFTKRLVTGAIVLLCGTALQRAEESTPETPASPFRSSEDDDGSEPDDANQETAAEAGLDLKAQREAALERREWLQNLLADYLEKYPESDIDGDGILTNPERSIHVAKLYRIDILMKLGDSVRFNGDIEYAKIGEESLTLDLYLPPTIDPEDRPPLVVWFHGGGWRGGSKDRCDVYWLATNGFAVASVEYRSTLQAPFPNNIHDCKAAIRWLRDNADTYGYNAGRIGTSGGSAGGHLAVLLGTSSGVPSLEGSVGSNLDQSSRVHAAVSMAGVMRVDDWPRSHLGLSTILGLAHSEDNGAYELARLCSPDEHLTPDDPPMLLFHGDNDNSVPRGQSEDFHARYVESGLTSTLQILANTNHVSPNFTDATRQRIIIDFFRRSLCDASPGTDGNCPGCTESRRGPSSGLRGSEPVSGHVPEHRGVCATSFPSIGAWGSRTGRFFGGRDRYFN